MHNTLLRMGVKISDTYSRAIAIDLPIYTIVKLPPRNWLAILYTTIATVVYTHFICERVNANLVKRYHPFRIMRARLVNMAERWGLR